MRSITFFVISYFTLLSLVLVAQEDSLRRIYAHLLIEDSKSAFQECETVFRQKGDCLAWKKAYLKALIANKQEDEALCLLSERDAKERDILEMLAWGILSRSEHSSQFSMNMASLMGAYFTFDVRAVHMLLRQMHSTHPVLRALAVQLAADYRDHMLIHGIQTLLKKEKNWFVRLEAIKTLGKMGAVSSQDQLHKIAISPNASIEEKQSALIALAELYETIDAQELEKLAGSSRAVLRCLCCHMIAHLDLISHIDLIQNLLTDSQTDVRIAALSALYMLGVKNCSAKCLSTLVLLNQDQDPFVAMTAAGLTLRFSPDYGLQTLSRWIYSSVQDYRLFAVCVLGHSPDKEAIKLAKNVFSLSSDPFVKVNLAIGLIKQGEYIQGACDVLYAFLMLNVDKISWNQIGTPFFSFLAPSKVYHLIHLPQYPVLIDQLTRLDLFHLLALFNYPYARDAIKTFLSHQVFGIAFTAGFTLLEHGEETLFVLKELLEDDNREIRLQAALVLALAGREKEALKVLQTAYQDAERGTKLKILGALGHIGDKQSIPFLISCMKQPHHTLQVFAASALIQCLYH